MRPLRPGSTIAIVAPSSPYDRTELFAGLAWLRTRYRLRIDARVLERTGYLAGSDDTRSAVLSAAMTDPSVDAILCARGGYGTMRLLEHLPWDAFVASPKRLLGFSDVTALHLVANARGVATIHAPNATGLGRSISAAERMAMLVALEDLSAPPWSDLVIVHAGARVRGTVFGGNLSLVAAMAAAGGLVVPPGAILVLEDVTEQPYRIDRMLTSLLLGGHLADAGAIVLGAFTSCRPGADGVTAEAVLAERTGGLGIPVVCRAPFGHEAPNHAFWLGREATLDGPSLEWDTHAANASSQRV